MRGHAAAVDAPLTAGGRAWGRSDQRCGQKRPAAGGQQAQSSDGGATQQQQHAGTKRRRWSVATQLIAGGALLVVLLLLVLVTAGAARRTTPGGAEAAEAAAPLTGGGGYLRQIAAVHDHQHQQQLKAVEGGAALFFDLQSTLQHCVSQLVMPAVKLPQHILGPAWHPPPSSSRRPDDALQQLSLDCSSPAHAAGCAEAAGSNLYEEGSLSALDPRDLALLLQDFNTTAAAASGGVLDDALQQLSLDCERQPAACAAVADASNAYEEGPDAAGISSSNRLAAAEAAAFFTSSEAASRSGSSWDALLGAHGLTEGGEQQQREELAAAHATNQYEGVQASSWQYRRQAEEAAAHYLDVSLLDLDCSEAAVQRDAHAHAECRRSRAVNRYEAGAADALAATAAAEEDEHDEHTPEAAGARAAVLPPQCGSSSSSLSSCSSTSAEARRLYFKNPCNSPLARGHFKNRSNHPMHRLHFKNPANAPASLAALLALSPLRPAPRAAPVAAPATAAAPAAARRQGTGVWPAGAVAVAVLLCSACCSKLLGWPASAAGKLPVQQQQPAEQQPRKGSRPWSCLLVPWGSQELPATPQLTEVEEPLPVLGALAGCGLAGPAPATLKALAGGSRYGERPVLPTAAATPFALAAGNLLPPCTPADGRGVAAPPASVGGLMLEQHQQQQDVVQDSRDSPRPPMYGPFSRGATQLPHSRAGTPLPTCKGD